MQRKPVYSTSQSFQERLMASLKLKGTKRRQTGSRPRLKLKTRNNGSDEEQ